MENRLAPKGKKRVLIVEDDQALGHALELKLLQAGYRIDWAKNGQEALAAWDQHTPDVIILDLLMPVMDGVDFLKELRVEREEKVPVIVLTVMTSGVLFDQCKAIGITDYLIKDKVSLDDVLACIRKLG